MEDIASKEPEAHFVFRGRFGVAAACLVSAVAIALIGGAAITWLPYTFTIAVMVAATSLCWLRSFRISIQIHLDYVVIRNFFATRRIRVGEAEYFYGHSPRTLLPFEFDNSTGAFRYPGGEVFPVMAMREISARALKEVEARLAIAGFYDREPSATAGQHFETN